LDNLRHGRDWRRSGGGLHIGGEIRALSHAGTFLCFLVGVKTGKHIFIFSIAFQATGKAW
jgi:hypothetical protein